MASLCPGCNKFCSMEMQEPENNSLELVCQEVVGIEEGEPVRHAEISGEIRIARNSECCGEEIKEYTFEISGGVTVKGHEGDDCELEIEEENLTGLEEGGGRYAKSYFGYDLTCSINCSCGELVEIVESDFGLSPSGAEDSKNCISITDKVAASEMDEC